MPKTIVRGLATADALPSSAYVPPILIATITCKWIDLQAVAGGAILASNPIDSALSWVAAAPSGQTRYVRTRVLTNSSANIPSWALDADGAHMNLTTFDAPGGINVARWWVPGGNFRSHYNDLMTKLGVKYDTNPAFALIFASMTMVEYAEPLMRFWSHGTNAAAYAAAGYTVAADKAAMHDCFTIHAAAFPNTPTGFAYNPYDGGGGSTNPVFAMTDQVATLGSNTQIQNNSMGNTGSASSAYITMYDSMAAAGGQLSFQLAAPANLAPGQTYYSASQTAIGYGATLIELNGSPSLMTTAQLDSVDAILRSVARPVLNAPDNGVPARAFSGQLYGKLPVSGSTGATIYPDGTSHQLSGLQIALLIANNYPFISSQATGGATNEWLQGYADSMIDPAASAVINAVTYHGLADRIIAPYDKLVVNDAAALPTYMQVNPTKQMQAGPLMQPTHVGSPSVSGYNEWGDYHANTRAKPRIDAANNLYPSSNPYNATWQDTAGPETYSNQQWWSGSGHTAGSLIAVGDWVTQERTVLDKIRTAVGSSIYIVVNGIRAKPSNFFNLIQSADMSMWENWGAWGSLTTPSTARPSDKQFQSMAQCFLDAQMLGKDVQALNTFAAASVSAGGTALRKAEEAICAMLLLSRNGSAGGHAVMEIALGGTAQTAPWGNGELMNPLYDQFVDGTGASIIGNPTDFYTSITSAIIANASDGHLYQRRHATGYVLYNSSANTPLASSLDGRHYTDLFTGASVGSSITVQPGEGRFLVTTASAADTTPPDVVIATPAASPYNEPVGTTSAPLTGTATDDTGVDHIDIINYTLGITVTVSNFPQAPIITEAFASSVVNGWSRLDTGAATGWNILTGASSTFSEGSGGGHITPAQGGAVSRIGVGVSIIDSEQLVRMKASAAAPATGSWQWYVAARYIDTSNLYRVFLQLLPSGAMQAKIQKLVAGVAADVGGAFQTIGTYVANSYWWVRFNVTGSTLRMRIWADGTTEPSGWTVTATDTSLTAAGDLTLGALAAAASGAFTASFDTYSVVDPDAAASNAKSVSWSGSVPVSATAVGPQGIGSNGVKVIAYDGAGNPSTPKYRSIITVANDTAAPLISISTASPSSVPNGTTTLAIAGIAAAPAGSVASISVQTGSQTPVAGTLGATTPAAVKMGPYVASSYTPGMTGFINTIGRSTNAERIVASFNYSSAITTQIQNDISSGRDVVLSWDVPPASGGLSGSQQIANGSQDTIISGKITALVAAGGTIYIALGYGMDDGHAGTATDFIAAWNHVRAVFIAAGATNCHFLWTADSRRIANGAAAAYWPGNSNVDAIGVNCLNTVAQGYSTPKALLDPALAFSAAHSSLPLVLADTGSEEFTATTGAGSKAQWIADLAAWINSNASNLLAWIWHEEVTSTGDLTAESTAAALAAFKSATRAFTFTDTRAWTATATGLAVGANTIRATATDSNGAISDFDTITVNRATASGAVPAPTTPAPRLSDTTSANRWQEGDVIHADAGGFSNSPTSYTFRWYRGTSSITPFRTTTTSSPFDDYTSSVADAGVSLHFDVVATNGTGQSVVVTSAASGVFSAPVTTAPSAPVLHAGSSITIIDTST